MKILYKIYLCYSLTNIDFVVHDIYMIFEKSLSYIGVERFLFPQVSSKNMNNIHICSITELLINRFTQIYLKQREELK